MRVPPRFSHDYCPTTCVGGAERYARMQPRLVRGIKKEKKRTRKPKTNLRIVLKHTPPPPLIA